MFDLLQALSDHDLPTLRIIGEWYELDLTGLQKPACVNALSDALTRVDMPEEITYLPPEESAAFLTIIAAGGRIPVAAFERNHGTVRQMGPGRMEREEPWLDPISPAEALWYRGFLYRAFDDNDDSNFDEFYYLPNELHEQFGGPDIESEIDQVDQEQLLVPIPAPDSFEPAPTDAVDDLTALLAAAQIDPLVEDGLSTVSHLLLNKNPDRLSLLYTLAWEMKLLRPTNLGAKPTRKVVEWLHQNRERQIRDMVDAWSTTSWSELFHTPGIECEGGDWEHEPALARTILVDSLPRDQMWYRLLDLVTSIKEKRPDFQRPGGNYDTWYIRDKQSDEYLTGFRSWNYVEGRQLAYVICGPVSWLGLVELAQPGLAEEVYFRLTPKALAWLGKESDGFESISLPIVVKDDASLIVPYNANSYHRFQVARIAEAETPIPGKPFVYRLTPSSLEQSRQQGIGPDRVLRFLEEASGRPVPASTRRAIERWGEKGTEAKLEHVVVLRVRDPEILDKLRAHPKTRPYIAETLGDLAVAVREGEQDQLREAAAQLGLLLDEGSAKD
ncbi:MAG: helicase-associated domain-containing protein [Candidatus Promineifilaceae bacterium]